MDEIVKSKNETKIRLTDERWSHIAEEHCELTGMRKEILETITNPLRLVEGSHEEILALREIEKGKFIVVIYRESSNDGFIITAFLTRRIKSILRRKQLWPK